MAHFEEQPFEIKKNMEAAMDQYIAYPALPQEINDLLLQYKSSIVWAVSSEELMCIVYKRIDLMTAIPIEVK